MWKEPEGGYMSFTIGSLYEVAPLKKKKFVKRKDTSTTRTEEFSLPLANAKHGNNGIMFYGKPSVFDSAEMTIDIVQNGAIATGDVYPQPFKTGVLWDAYLIKAIHWQDSQETLLYFSTVIKKTIKEKFSYDKKATWERVKEEFIYLPVTKQKKIDFAFIDECVRKLEDEYVRELEIYLSVAGFDDCTITQKEKDTIQSLRENKVRHKLFRIDELFDIATGRDIIIGRTKEGNVPLISHQHDDNGISKRIERIENRRLFDYNTTLSLADRGVFLATTQAEDFHIGTRVKALTFKTGCQTENVRLFFVTAINKLQTLFVDYLTNATDNLPNLQISIPVDSNGNIDYGFIDIYVSAIKKEYISRIKQEIEREHKEYGQVIGNQTGKVKAIELNKTDSYYTEADFEPLMAAEPFECYKWEGFDQSICDFFGGNKTILIGCYKGKKYKDWIHTHNIYTIRLGDTKGSMEANRELFDGTSLLILYELGKPNKLSAYKIVGNKEMGKEELLAMDYPNKKPRKSYMTFSITPLEVDLTFLVEHHLIERLIELNSDNVKGTPVFIQP